MAWANAVNATQTGLQTINAGVWTGSTTTQYNVLVGDTNNAVANVAPSATSGIPMISGGSSANPSFGTAVVAGGGTGLTALTAHYLIIGNGTSAATLLAPSATSGVPLISQGSSADPAYGTAVVAGGGTGAVTFTAYSVVCAGTTATGAFQNVSGLGSSGQVLTSNGAGALPSWQAASGSVTWTDLGTPGALSANTGYFLTGAGAYTLPASPGQGATIRIICQAASGVIITGNTGQVIQIGSTASSAAGTATSTAKGDSLVLVYRSADTTWYCESGAAGNWTTA